MRLSSLGLTSFRNYESEQLTFSDGIALFYGANAQGKTNILESVFLCTCARSHRTSKDQELVKSGQDFYQVEISYDTDSAGEQDLLIHYDQVKAKRTIWHMGLKLERLADLMGLFHAVIFAPEDLAIVKGGPAERRRFINLLISQVRPRYFKELAIYQKTLLQRNKLLKQLRDREEQELDALQLDIWDEQLAVSGAYVMATRQYFANKIEQRANAALRDITGGKEKLSLRYRSFGAKQETEDEIKEAYVERLKMARRDDLMRGSTGYGPHRDDLDIELDDKDVRAFASQGQQRSITLALRIAELAVLHEESKEAPVLLLDDVMSELDVERRTNLLKAIEGYQVLMTCTDLHQVFSPKVANAIYEEKTNLDDVDAEKKDQLSRLGRLHFYKVEDGNVHFRGTLN